MQSSLAAAGHSTAVMRAASYYSPVSNFQDRIAGIGYFRLIEDLEKHFEEKKEILKENLKKLMLLIFRPENLFVSVTTDEKGYLGVEGRVSTLRHLLYQIPVQTGKIHYDLEQKNEGFSTAGQVQYVAVSGNYKEAGYAYTGALRILKVILSYDYLWINLRVKGGAYGCMSGFKRSGESYFVSYRDPHLRRTLEVYEGVPEYVRTFAADEREMTKYIIGTISGKDVPRTPQTQGALGRMAYFRGLTVEMLQKERDQILNATVEDIHALAPLIQAVLSDDQLCVVGSENAIEKAKDVFMETKPLVSC